jgi:hypothetical protein
LMSDQPTKALWVKRVLDVDVGRFGDQPDSTGTANSAD